MKTFNNLLQQTWHKASLYVGIQGIQVCSNEGPHPFPSGDNYEIANMHWRKSSCPESQGQFQPNLEQSILRLRANEEPSPFQRGVYYEIAKINWRHLKIFFSRTTEPISKGTKHPWVKEIQFYSNDGLCPFSREDNFEIANMHWRYIKVFFLRTTWPISTKLGTKHLWVSEFNFVQMKDPALSKGRQLRINEI